LERADAVRGWTAGSPGPDTGSTLREVVAVTLLRIQHAVPSYDGWKRAFDSDPVDRRGSGVRRYWVRRPVDDPELVMIDLELDSADAAEALLERLRELWAGPAKAVTRDPQAWVVETVETTTL
jgi:hypothetical protein